jgi:hypothetical protein
VGAEVDLAQTRLTWLWVNLYSQRARLVVAGALGGYFWLLEALGGHSKWTKLGVPNDFHWFDDLRNVTSAWECARQHIAVLPSNPCDPFHRPTNYPRLWLLPSHLGLGQGDTHTIGWIIVGCFFAAAVLVTPPGASIRTGLLYVLALCSPAAMLGVERGNIDLTMFPLLLLAVLISRRRIRGLIVSGACVLLAAVLKLHPIFAVGFLVRRRSRPALITAGAVLVAFAAYVIALHTQIHQVVSAVPQEDKYSYGLRRITEWISAATEGSTATRASLPGWDVLLLLATAVIAYLLAKRLRPRLAAQRDDPASRRDLDLFWAGACIYVGTYAIARNFDYRLIFCLLTVPQLARWAGAGYKLAYVTIVGLLGAMWLDGWYDSRTVHHVLDGWSGWTAAGPNAQTIPLSAISQFVLFGCLVGWLVATAPSLSIRRRAAG